MNYEKLFKKYPYLDDQDKQKFISVMEDESIKELLQRVERRRKLILFGAILFFIVLTALLILSMYLKEVTPSMQNTSKEGSFFQSLFFFLLVFILPIHYFGKYYDTYVKKVVKRHVLSALVSQVRSDIDYNDEKITQESLFIPNPQGSGFIVRPSTYEETVFLKNLYGEYRIQESEEIFTENQVRKKEKPKAYIEDFIHFVQKDAQDTPSIVYEGAEIWENWRSQYRVRIELKNPRRKISQTIKILSRKTNHSIFQGLFKVMVFAFKCLLLATLLLPLAIFLNTYGIASTFSISIIIVFVLSGLILFFGSYLIAFVFVVGKLLERAYAKVKLAHEVSLENAEFQKKYRVICEDSLQARAFLTPDCVFRIVDFSKKIDEKRVYDFFFEDNYFYVVFDIKRSGKIHYMDFSPFANLTTNLKDYIEFYQEVKNLSTLGKDLKILLYDQEAFNTQIL